MASSFSDDRGLIEDLLTEPLDSVTRIFTVAGAVRGNHVHAQTVQVTYIVSGRLHVMTRAPGGPVVSRLIGPGEMIREEPGVAHAWQATEDCTVLVFTRGPRSGEGYESDTTRLAPGDRLL
jgi:quercetin dioxygenase-like cupin family protein